MGGNCGVDSVLGKGTTFWIELPRGENLSLSNEKAEALYGGKTLLTRKSGTILYIEDNLSNVELVEQILVNLQAEIKLVTDCYGERTVPLAIEHQPDLILLDLNLPDIHGSVVFEQLRAQGQTKNIPVVVISADAMPRQMNKLLKAGVKNYLTKPLDIPAFIQTLEEIFSGNNPVIS